MLPKNEKEALFDVDDRISMLERRLDNAKAARDAFVHHLRGKYPTWTPPLPVMSYQEGNFPSINSSMPVYHQTRSSSQPREPLATRLATGDYQWDVDNQQGLKDRMLIRSAPRYHASYATIPMDIPTGGPLLESDIRRSKIRLREISEELRAMRVDRMNLSTEQWMQEQGFRQHKALSLHFGGPAHTIHPPVDHLDQARLHLSRIDLTETSPVETPKTERRIELEMSENYENRLEQMRGGAEPVVRLQEAPPTLAPPPAVQAPVTQAPVQAPPPVVSVAQALPVQAPPPVVEAPPTQAPPTQAPPPAAPSGVSAAMKALGIGGVGMISSDEDSPRPRFQAPPTSSGAVNFADLLSNITGGGGGGANFSSDDDDDLPVTRGGAKWGEATTKKQIDWNNDDDFFD